MRRRDLLNLGAGTAAFSLAELAWQRAGHPALGACAPVGDPLQALLDGNARFVDFENATSRHPPRRHGNGYWPTTGKTTATW